MTALPRYPRDIEQAVQASVCPRLLDTANLIRDALSRSKPEATKREDTP